MKRLPLILLVMTVLFTGIACDDDTKNNNNNDQSGTITPPQPIIGNMVFEVTPNEGIKGDYLNIFISSSQDMMSTVTDVDFGDRIVVEDFQADTEQLLWVRIHIEFHADHGEFDIVLSTESGEYEIPAGFTVYPTEKLSGIFEYSLYRDESIYGDEMNVGGAFVRPYEKLYDWFINIPTMPALGTMEYRCVGDYICDTTSIELQDPQFLDAADSMIFTGADDIDYTLYKYFYDPYNSTKYFYMSYEGMPTTAFDYGKTISMEYDGNNEFPRFSHEFTTPTQLTLTSHSFVGNEMDFVQNKDMKLTWEGDANTESEVYIGVASFSMLGIEDWILYTVPDTGSFTIPADDVALLAWPWVYVNIWKQTDSYIQVRGHAPVYVYSRVIYSNTGSRYVEGTQLVNVNQNFIHQGDSKTVKLRTTNIDLTQPGLSVTFGGGTTVSDLTVVDEENASLTLTVDLQSPKGYRSLYISYDGLSEAIQFESILRVLGSQLTCNGTELDAPISGNFNDGDIICGTLDTDSDTDAYYFSATAGEVFIIDSQADSFGSPLTLASIVQPADGSTDLVSRSLGDNVITFVPEEDGDYRLLIVHDDWQNEFGPENEYTVSFNRYTPVELPAGPGAEQDTCTWSEALTPLLYDTFYHGDTMDGHTDTTYEDFVGYEDESSYGFCSINYNAQAGYDAVYPLTLGAGETLIAWVIMPVQEATAFLLEECGDMASCVFGDATNIWREPSELTIRNDSASEKTYYLAVDMYYSSLTDHRPPGGDFYILLSKY